MVLPAPRENGPGRQPGQPPEAPPAGPLLRSSVYSESTASNESLKRPEYERVRSLRTQQRAESQCQVLPRALGSLWLFSVWDSFG